MPGSTGEAKAQQRQDNGVQGVSELTLGAQLTGEAKAQQR